MTVWAVTGASGYIGSVLIRRLIAAGATVRGLSRRPVTISSATVVKGEICDASAVSRLVDDSDVVVHLAAYVHRRVTSGGERGQTCHATNVEGTRTVIEACSSVASHPFLVFVSSASVYGESANSIDENAPIAPQTYYGETKAEAERLVLDAVAREQIRGVILRPAVVFGAGAPGNPTQFARMIRRGFFPAVSGGRARKTLVPVGMLVAAIIAVVADCDQTNGHIFNVGGDSLSMRRIAQVIADACGVKLRVISVPLRPLRLAGTLLGLSSIIDPYVSSVMISDARLRALPSFHWPHLIETALAHSVRGNDLF